LSDDQQLCRSDPSKLAAKMNVDLLVDTGVNPAGDAGDTSPPIFWLGDVNGNIHTNIITYFRI